ncbi:DUF559 domain-containing protein [Sphingomonas sp. So64.6b]|uniref:endonuclease domain-containing protein n=1 Tax=Sphingomonas sp. So64.6b TaxID=2997354 RepID=UPI0016039A12|nr:DUF559 domain-containing protein [Sphingomonas sp. So64.6b]QNA84244.1 DUF559 domain-containing protein [Sphingomonas sp. So64.6b]
MSDKGYARPTMRARELRANATDAERRLWAHLSARKIAGARFNRQVPIGPFICDFVSRGAKLVIEVDGGQHDWNAETDRTRTRYIESHGFRVIRFWNNDVMESIEGVVAKIEQALADRPSPNPSREREGSFGARSTIVGDKS